MKYFHLSLLVLLIGVSALSQHKYYFSNGTKLAERVTNGTKQHPFSDLAMLAKLQLQYGDTVFFSGGNVFNGTINLDNIHGKPGKPVVFTSYRKGKATIYAGSREGFLLTASNDLSINNLIVTGLGRKEGNTTDGVKLVNCSSVNINKLEIAGFQKSGLILFNCQSARIEEVVARDNGFAGILVDGDYQKRLSDEIYIARCRADNNPGDPTNLSNHSGNGILVGNCKNVRIENCTASHNGWDMPRIGNGPVGIWAYEAYSVIIQHCIAYRNITATGAADGGGFDLDGGVTNSVIQYCLSFENEGSGYGIFQYYGAGQWENNVLRYCISINDGRVTENASGMYIWNGWNGDSTFTDFYAYNNFFYNDTRYAFSFSPLSRHRRFHFFNNVFIASDTSDIYYGADSSTTDVFCGNVWARKNGGFMQNNFKSLEEWARSTGYETKDGRFMGITFDRKIFDLPGHIDISAPYSLTTNPSLKLVCNTILLNKGIDLKKIFGIDAGKMDFFGHPVPRGTGPEPGVCEIE